MDAPFGREFVYRSVPQNRCREAILAMHLESAAFLGHITDQEPNESSGHCEPRVLKPLTGGFWLALSANKTDAPNTRVFF
jgi:hypothetical protein